MGWKDDPVVSDATSSVSWKNDPVVGKEPSKTQEAPPKDYGFLGNVVGGVVEPIAAMGSSMIAKPVSEVMGLSALTRELLPGGPKGDPRAFQQDVQRRLTYEPKTPAGQSPANPLNFIPSLLGKIVSGIGQYGGGIVAPPGSGPVREAIGKGVTEAIEQAPAILGGKTAAAAPAAGKALESGARSFMSSALKAPIKAGKEGKTEKAIDTLLQEGINVTPGGMEKLDAKISTLNDQVDALTKHSPLSIDKKKVVAPLFDLYQRFQKQVTPSSDLATLQRAYDEFMNHPLLASRQIPVPLAQEMKRATYRSLKDKSYGELKGADIEAQKALARGIKDEVAKAVPEVRPLNTKESELLNALSLVERRVLVEANKNPVGLGLLSMKPTHMLAWMADRSGLFKSLVARMLNTTGGAVSKAGPMAAPIGMAASNQALQPPPQ